MEASTYHSLVHHDLGWCLGLWGAEVDARQIRLGIFPTFPSKSLKDQVSALFSVHPLDQ